MRGGDGACLYMGGGVSQGATQSVTRRGELSPHLSSATPGPVWQVCASFGLGPRFRLGSSARIPGRTSARWCHLSQFSRGSFLSSPLVRDLRVPLCSPRFHVAPGAACCTPHLAATQDFRGAPRTPQPCRLHSASFLGAHGRVVRSWDQRCAQYRVDCTDFQHKSRKNYPPGAPIF